MFLCDEKGTTSIEYVVILSFMTLALISGLTLFLPQVTLPFETIGNSISNEHQDCRGTAGISCSGLGDGTNPGKGKGKDNSPNQGVNNPGHGHVWP